MGRNIMETLRYNTFWNMTAIITSFLLVNYAASYAYAIHDLEDFLSIHLIIELTSVLIAFSICIMVWLTREGFDDYSGRFILLFGLTFFAVALVDLMHALSYNGMLHFVTPGNQQKSIFLWLYGRYMVVLGFFIALLWPKETTFQLRRAIHILATTACTLTLIAFLLATLYLDLVPLLYRDSLGLTPLKICLEYILIGIYIIEGILLWRIRGKLRESIFKYLLYFLLFTVFSELTLTCYENAYNTYSFLGHIYKLTAYYFLFKAIYVSGVLHHFFTLGEMGKMSAELLKEKISLEAVLQIEMPKLKKLIPQAEQICVNLVTDGPSCFRTAYSWGKLCELFPVGGEYCVGNSNNSSPNIQVFTDPTNLLQVLCEKDCTPSISVILKVSKQVLRIPLLTKGILHGVINLYIFKSNSHFGPEAIEKAKVFQQFITLAISQAKNQETIMKLSFEDSLTGIPNRRCFFEELSKIKYDADEYGLPFTVIYLDMNGLKYLNDHMGHEAGDQALQLIGRSLKKAARQSDVPARLGGDEFGILFRHMTLAKAQEKITELKNEFARLRLVEFDHSFSLAVGGASYPDEATNEEELLSLADDRMYEHKRQMKANQKDENNESFKYHLSI